MAAHDLSVDNSRRVLAVVEVLHVFVDVVFLADLLPQRDSHLVTPVVAHLAVRVLVGSEHFVHRVSLFTTPRRTKI